MINSNLYFKEFKRNAKSLVIWTAIVLAFTVLVMSVFPYMKDMGEAMSIMVSKMPEALTKAMGVDANTFNSILATYNTYYPVYIVVLLAIFTSSTAATIISKEEKEKTAEFLMTKPISRKSIFSTKLAVLLSLTMTAYIVQTLVAILMVSILGEDDVKWSTFTTMHIHGLILIFLFTALGLFLSMLIKSRKNFIGILVAIVFGSYFIHTIARVANPISWLGYISPFHYLDFDVTNPNYSISYLQGAIILLLSLLLMFVSYKIYEQKDINA